jgi:hypothetical protein
LMSYCRINGLNYKVRDVLESPFTAVVMFLHVHLVTNPSFYGNHKKRKRYNKLPVRISKLLRRS